MVKKTPVKQNLNAEENTKFKNIWLTTELNFMIKLLMGLRNKMYPDFRVN